MQTVSELYKTLIADGDHEKEVRVDVGGVSYFGADTQIKYLATYGSLFSTVGIGNTVSREIELSISPVGNIPRMAELRPYIRVRLGEQVSEWIPKGVFYIDTRQPDEASGTLTIHGYDAILLHGSEPYLQEDDVGVWPRSCVTVVNDLAARFGVELDPRTNLDAAVLVPFPNDWTCRELLGFIGAAHAGNWTITDAGKLRLVPLWSVPAETHYLVDQNGDPITFGGHRILLSADTQQGASDSGSGQVNLERNMEQYGAPESFEPFSRVTMWYDDENAFTAGDDTGRTLECDCPFASQAIAEKVLAAVRGYSYQPFEAAGAILDPAAELGDGVSANGVYSVLASCTTTFNALMVSDIAAPADEEIDHEMPYESRIQLAMKRKLTLGKNYYGVRVTKSGGLQIVKNAADGREINRATFNTDQLAMYDDNGTARIFFDTATGRYKFVGDIDISGGNINLSGGVIQWGDNLPDGGISADQAKTLISGELVSSPKIAGGKFMDLAQKSWLEMGNSADGKVAYINHLYDGFSATDPVMVMGYTNPTGVMPQWVLAPFFNIAMTYMQSNDTMFANGKWNFGQATINGNLGSDEDLSFSAGDGTVAMRLDPDNDRINFYVGGVTWVLTADGLSKL